MQSIVFRPVFVGNKVVANPPPIVATDAQFYSFRNVAGERERQG